MSHFTVLVNCGPLVDVEDHKSAVERVLARFDENIVMDPYVTGELRPEAKLRFMGYYSRKYEQDAQLGFEAMYAKYGEGWNGMSWQLLDLGDGLKYYEVSQYNPLSKWDWYCVGGRWSDSIRRLGRAGGYDYARKREIDFEAMSSNGDPFRPFAFVTPDGVWIESAQMGWWAMTSNDNAAFDDQYERFIKRSGENDVLVLVDCHI